MFRFIQTFIKKIMDSKNSMDSMDPMVKTIDMESIINHIGSVVPLVVPSPVVPLPVVPLPVVPLPVVPLVVPLVVPFVVPLPVVPLVVPSLGRAHV